MVQAPDVKNFQPKHKGHAIEVRLNAEDPFRNFAPSAGTLGLVQWPQGKFVKTDAKCFLGCCKVGRCSSLTVLRCVTTRL